MDVHGLTIYDLIERGASLYGEAPAFIQGERSLSFRELPRRVEALADGQQLLPGVGYLHFAFITDREGDMFELEADHRQHAVVENVIRDLKYGLALNHMPSGKFGVNAAWLAMNVIAHNLVALFL